MYNKARKDLVNTYNSEQVTYHSGKSITYNQLPRKNILK